jgi:hypothetical protein
MEGFHNPEMTGRAAHALALATRRGLGTDRAGLITLARQVLTQAEPLALVEPEEVLTEAQGIVEADLWEAVDPGADYQDPVEALAKESLDRATSDRAMDLLDSTDGPSTPGDAYDACADLSLILVGILHALHLAQDVNHEDAVRELSDGRLTGGTEPAARPVATVPTAHRSFADQ